MKTHAPKMLKTHSKIHIRVARDQSIPAEVRGFYAVLCSYVDKNRTCYPGLNLLADTMDVTNRTVIRWLSVLESKGVLVRVTDPGKKTAIILKDKL